jgi:hypothetical protein
VKPALAPPKVLAAGVIAFTAALASYLIYLAIHPPDWTVHPVDLHIYVAGGLIVRHVPPFYRPRLAAPLYGWADPGLGLKWDLTQPDTRASRWWKGAGVGIAAGIKLVPLIFIP